MKVKELIEELNKVNPELEVLIARDEEGNGFSFLSGFGFGDFEADRWEVEFYSWAKDEDGEEIYPSVEIKPEDATAICFWP